MLNNTLLSYCLQKATEAAKDKKVSVYAVAVNKRDRVIAEAGNDYVKTSPKQALYARLAGLPHKQFLHAEILVLTRALKRGENTAKLYIARAGKQGQSLPAKPCSICQLFIDTEFPNIEIIHT